LALSPPGNDSKSKPGSRDEAAQDGFLREVDEALREEQLVSAFKRYAKPVGGILVAGLLALGGYLYWDNSVKNSAALTAERSVMALDRIEAGDVGSAVKDLELLAKDESPGVRAMALMQLAAIAAQQGKDDEAAKKFAAIADDPKLPQPYRDLARVREVSLRFDAMKPEEVIAKLKPLAVPGNAFFGSAGELVGMAYLEQGKPDLAGALFAQIAKDASLPASLRSRMRQMASGLGFDAGLGDAVLNDEGDEAASAGSAAPAPAKQ
jgi:hypothetical protein